MSTSRSVTYDISKLAGINPTEVFKSFFTNVAEYIYLEPISFTGWSTLLLVQDLRAAERRVAKGLFGYNSVLAAAPEDLRSELYGYYWYRQLPDSAHAYMEKQFSQEMEVLEALSGTGFAPELYERDATADIPYYVMQYLPLGSVRSWRMSNSVGPSDVLDFSRRLLVAVQRLHQAGFIHRDLNAENILVGDDGPLIADFGCARRVHNHEESSGKSPILHWPPEYDRAYDDASVQSDLYCFGMVVYELMTGTLPRYGAPPLSAVTKDQDRRLVRLVESCISWEPEKRPGDAAECLRNL
jgi:serine/threonine protein kinase